MSFFCLNTLDLREEEWAEPSCEAKLNLILLERETIFLVSIDVKERVLYL